MKTILAHEDNYCKDTKQRTVKKICLHHAAGVGSAEDIAKTFQTPNLQASATYCIGVGGDVVLSVPEEYIPYSNSNWTSNCESITIECSDKNMIWEISDETLYSLVKLMADICKRYNIDPIAEDTITYHCMFAPTICPGQDILNKLDMIIDMVRMILYGGVDEYAIDAILWAMRHDILRGDGNGNYMLKDNVTRQDMLVFLHRMNKME